MAPEDARERGDEAGPDFWRCEAERYRRIVEELQEERRAMLAPEQFRFRGIRGDTMWDRDLLKIPANLLDRAKSKMPELESWHQFVFGPILIALSPEDATTSIVAEKVILRDA
ncbi:MAG: hypothetical protein P4L67_04770 [Candidatus Pacebacteria bacterium]|nr:hypothetical protein [Candidatus Paceibacterota bacterium]